MPGGKICSVAICKNNARTLKKKGANVTFFSFPKDPAVRKKWVRKCYRKDQFNPENKRICSDHFTLEDYEDRMEARLMNTRPKRLKKSAVPSLMLHPSTSNLNGITQSAPDQVNQAQRGRFKTSMDVPLTYEQEVICSLEDPSEMSQPPSSSDFHNSQNEIVIVELQKRNELSTHLSYANQTLRQKIV